ncbi:MAG: hypothetical protein ACOX0T_08180 [Pelotomaculum sp.]
MTHDGGFYPGYPLRPDSRLKALPGLQKTPALGQAALTGSH